jgi:tRNA-uridine 2-sulfurtransferase
MKALGLLSGGLDSTLAVKLILERGIDVETINFVTPFCLCRKGGCGASEAAKTFNIPLKMVSAGTDYLRLVRHPRFGYGKNMNPCVDCRIFMLKKANKYAKEIGAKFIFRRSPRSTPHVSTSRRVGPYREGSGFGGKNSAPAFWEAFA